MADTIKPGDIGLALAEDLGDVSDLQTVSKVIVAAINELKENGAGGTSNGDSNGSIGNFEQLYHEGENNTILGNNNAVHGNNNVILGENNIVIGDNHFIIGNNRQVTKKLPSLTGTITGMNFNDKSLLFLSNVLVIANIVMGDKFIMRTRRVYVNPKTNQTLDVYSDLFISEVLRVENGEKAFFDIFVAPVTTDIPPEYTISVAFMGEVSAVLKDNFKITGSNAVQMGDIAKAVDSFTANIGLAEGKNSLAANSGKSYAENGTALNISNCYGYNGCSINYGYSLGRAFKCTHFSYSGRYLTAAENEGISGLVGYKIFVRLMSNTGTVTNSTPTVTSVTGQNIYFEETIGSSSLKVATDGYCFRIADSYGSSFAHGRGRAGGQFSRAGGVYTIAAHEGAEICGKYGATPEDYSFSLANGTSDMNPGLAVKMLQNGDIYADGTFSSPCADYSELFEWLDGNPDNEDRAGLFVTLKDDKIKFTEDFEDWLPDSGFILGVISASPAIIGDTGELRWADKYITDDFGRITYHDVIIPEEKDEDENIMVTEHMEVQPVLNPNWNPAVEYTPRTKRKEWAAVGVLGKLRVWDDGTCVVGGICRPSAGGIATKSIKNGYRVLKRISENIILIWVK